MMLTLVALIAAIAWIVLLFFRQDFWRADQRLPARYADPAAWPAVVAVVPARNEAPTIGRCVKSLLDQDYPGPFSVVVIDDSSSDGTGEIARATADGSNRLTVLAAPPLETGWTGKLWAVNAGLAEADRHGPPFVWLTDADTVHGPEVLRRLVAQAEGHGRDLVSLMVRLHCTAFWERMLIPAFVFFFQMLYPFRAANDDRSRVAAAAGGCVLLRRAALARAGGIAAIKGELIDDCALARAIKDNGGRLWVGLANHSYSLRGAAGLAPLWAMVRRSAFTQLRHSVTLVTGTAIAIAVVFVAPAVIVLTWPWHHETKPALLALFGWLAMGVAYRPTLRDYGLAPLRGIALPLTAALYAAMTVDSALTSLRGSGGGWKGRHYGPSAEASDMSKSRL